MAKNNISRLLSTESRFFTLSSLQALFNITRQSARTTAFRLVERGILVRLRRDLYPLVKTKYSLFALANAPYQPSVISLETALNYWGHDYRNWIRTSFLADFKRLVRNRIRELEHSRIPAR